jgi:hypothetical protein
MTTMRTMREDLMALLSRRHDDGKKHAVFGILLFDEQDTSYLEAACDLAYQYDWHVVSVWERGNRTMILFRSRPR